MTERPLVSSIVSFLNQEPFLEEAIQSIFAQTYTHWELLLIDDGSVDGSTAIAKHWANKAPAKVRYLDHKNHQTLGGSASRNLGIHNSNGKYIAFLEDGDFWLPRKLEQQVMILEAHPEAALIIGATYIWYGWTNKPEDILRDCIVPLGIDTNTLIQPPNLFTLLLQDETKIPATCDVLLRRERYDWVDGFEESDRGFDADLVFYTQLYYNASIYVASRCWARHRQPANSSNPPLDAQSQGRERANFLRWVETYLTGPSTQNTEAWNVLQQALWPYRHPRLNQLRESPKLLQRMVKTLEILLLPLSIRHWLGVRWHRRKLVPWVGWVRFGHLRRLSPISPIHGFERGQPVDRYYIEMFLGHQSADIQGHVLEICDPFYTFKFGGDRVTKSDVLDADEENPIATLIADLANAEQIPPNTFDCIILTQTLQFIYDIQAVLQTVYRILKPGGVLLLTVPCISRFDQLNTNKWGEYWRFTTYSIHRLLAEVFPACQLMVKAYGNVFTSTAFLYGIATEELRQEELNDHDPTYELLVTARAVKPREPS
jgi:glycosyltransferase involved in cell wall biosynthesis